MSGAVVRTLSVASKFLVNHEHPEVELNLALALNLYDRCELTLKSSNGKEFLRNAATAKKLLGCIESVRKHGLGLILAVSTYQNSSNHDSSICSFKATRTGREEVIKRICPNNVTSREKTKVLLHDCEHQLMKSKNDRYILSYFRYENFNQCVCGNCVEAFAAYVHEKERFFHFENAYDLLQPETFLDWITWKQLRIENALTDYLSSTSKPIIVEIDFDLTKRYLSGPMIEEGLMFDNIVRLVPELYLHIEPCTPITKHFFSQRPKEGYLNHLRYLLHLADSMDCRIHFFFWFPGKIGPTSTLLRYSVQMVNEVCPYGVVFYTEDPLEFTRQLSEYV